MGLWLRLFLLFKNVVVFHDFHHHPPRRNRIRLGVVVVEFDAEMGRHSAELVVGQVGPGLAGEVKGALMLEAWRRNINVLQQGVQHMQIEAGFVGDDEVGLGEVGDDFGCDAAELGLVANVEPADAVDVSSPFFDEPAVTFGWLDEPVRGCDEFAVLKESEAEGAGAQGAVIGRFKVDGEDFHDRRLVRQNEGLRECVTWLVNRILANAPKH